jgi:hypothetical protein
MPRTPIEYSRTIIYKLVCKDLAIKELYVGATTNWFNRQGTHKSTCNNENHKGYNCKVYQFIRENGDWNNWVMIMVEKYPCKDKLESDAREHYWTELLEAKLNMNVVGRTKKEYEEANKEYFAEKAKEFYQANKEEILEKNKQWRDNHKEEILENNKKYREEHKEEFVVRNQKYYEANKEEHSKKSKIYRKEHKEEIIEQHKLYYEANKEKINIKIREKYTCECGSIICKGEKSQHNKSKKHLKYMDTLNGKKDIPTIE